MTDWRNFLLDYLDYLGASYNVEREFVTTFSQDGRNVQEVRYSFAKKDHKPGVLGFYPGTNFFYRILEGCLQRGAFASAYLTESKFVPSNKPFVPYLYLCVQVVSPAIKTPRKNYSVIINMYNGAIFLNPSLKEFQPVEKGEVLPRTVSYKEAFESVLEYIKEDLISRKDWLQENQKIRDVFMNNLKNAGLSKAEEETRLAEAKARLFPHFKAQLKVLARLYIN